MPELFKERCPAGIYETLPAAEFVPFRGAGRDFIDLPETVAEAEKLLSKPVPALPATLYMRFHRDGNRSEYEAPYFARRRAAQHLLFAELTEGRGRFTDLLADYVWAICEETTWVLPAHNKACHGNPVNCLTDCFDLGDDDDTRNVDLFSAATGADLAVIWYFGAGILDGITPVIRSRIRSLLERRIFHVWYDVKGAPNWWMGDRGEKLNNWTPWIVSNILTAVMLCESDDGRRSRSISRAAELLDRFTKDYPGDGGCDEGPGYWTVAGASYFDCLEIIRDMTGGRTDLTGHPFVRKMCEYIADFNLFGNTWVNFADASHLLSCDRALIARMGRECGSDKLLSFAAEGANPASFGRYFPGQTPYRTLTDTLEPVPERAERKQPGDVLYPDLGVMIARGGPFAAAVKGGHNDESHNHNDIGNFVLYKNGQPVFVDAGVEQYCRDTFSSKRYTLWTMRSLYHNLPKISGYEQPHGRKYRGEILSCDGGMLELELKDAYPEECGLVSFVRKAGIRGGRFVCEDTFVFRNSGSVVFSLMTPDDPQPRDAGFILPSSDAVVAWTGTLSYSTDAVELGPKLLREWGKERLTRIRLASGEFREARFRLTVI